MKAAPGFRNLAQTTGATLPLYDGNGFFKVYCPVNGRIEIVRFYISTSAKPTHLLETSSLVYNRGNDDDEYFTRPLDSKPLLDLT